MRRVLTRTALLGVLVLAACTDGLQDSTLPSEPQVGGPQAADVPGTCTTLAELNRLAKVVFASGNPNANSVIGKISNMDKQIKKGNIATAQQHAIDIVSFILKKKGSFQPEATLLLFINQVLCYAGFPAALTDLGGIVVTTASETQTTEVIRDDQQAGFVAPPGAFDAPAGTLILVTISQVPKLLNTLLDQYPGVFNFTSSAELDGTVVLGVCLTVSLPDFISVDDLRLGHDRPDLGPGKFEITQFAPPPAGLNCDPTPPPPAPPSFGIMSRLSPVLAAVGRWFLPQPASAAVLAGGGVGGLAGKLSPFGPVDPVLSATGGTGGQAGKLSPPALRSVLGGGPRPAVLDCSFPVGTQVSLECRPQVTIMTALYKAWLDGGQVGPQQGNLIPDVPVEFEVGSGGGFVGAEGACTPSASIVTDTTDASGFARVCWTLGPVIGEQKVWVTPDVGSLPPDVTFDPATLTFFATGTASGDPLPIPYESSGWSYQINGSVPADWFSSTLTPFALTGQGGFGEDHNACTLITSGTHTAWPAGTNDGPGSTTLRARRTFFLTATELVRISIAIDNDVQVFLDGVDISASNEQGATPNGLGLLVHDGCPTLNSFTFVQSLGAGSHLLAIRAFDRGGSSYVDASVTVVAP